MTTNSQIAETMSLTELMSSLPPMQGRASMRIIDSQRATLRHSDGRPGELYRDEDLWAYRIAGDDKHQEEEGWLTYSEELAELLGCYWSIKDANNEIVELELGTEG